MKRALALCLTAILLWPLVLVAAGKGPESVTAPLKSAQAYVKTMPINNTQTILYKDNANYAKAVLATGIAVKANLGTAALFIYAQVGEDTAEISIEGKKYPLVYSPIEYQCTDLTFVHGRYFDTVRVLLGHWAKNSTDPVKRNQIAEAVANTIEIAKRNGVDLEKVIKDKIDLIVKDEFKRMPEFAYWPEVSKQTIKDTIYNFCIKPTHESFMKVVGIGALWSKYIVYNSSFTTSSGCLLNTLSSINPDLSTTFNAVSNGNLRNPIYAYLGFKNSAEYDDFVKKIIVPGK